MGLKQRHDFGAGVTSTQQIYNAVQTANLKDQGGSWTTNPVGPYSIKETANLVFTNGIVGTNLKNINIADGERRPGCAASSFMRG
jgi:hypothetical protein